MQEKLVMVILRFFWETGGGAFGKIKDESGGSSLFFAVTGGGVPTEDPEVSVGGGGNTIVYMFTLYSSILFIKLRIWQQLS